MRTDLSRVLVVDVEATCWETREEQGDRPNDIIEIGICEIHRTGGVQNISSYIVKPQFTTVSPFCTQLTGWKQEDVEGAADLGATLKQIGIDYNLSRDLVWFSYGEYDRAKLSSDVAQKGGAWELYNIRWMDNPFAQMRHFNIKTLLALKEGLSKEIGMERALAHYGMTLDGRHHNGADDAANIAKLVMKVLS